MRALCAAGAACVHYLAGKESINISGKCHSGLARQELSKIYACLHGSALISLYFDIPTLYFPYTLISLYFNFPTLISLDYDFPIHR